MKKILMALSSFFFGLTAVVAMNSFVNNNNVFIDVNSYNWMNEYLSDIRIMNMNQEEYSDFLKLNYRLVKKSEKYFVTNTLVNKNKLIEPLSITTEITKMQYDNIENTRWACDCDDDEVCWETNVKKLIMSVGCTENNDTACGFYIRNVWKTNPSARYYDVIAIRWSGLTMNEMEGNQYAYIDDIFNSTHYTVNSNNTKYTSNGVGVSMNLYNNGE